MWRIYSTYSGEWTFSLFCMWGLNLHLLYLLFIFFFNSVFGPRDRLIQETNSTVQPGQSPYGLTHHFVFILYNIVSIHINKNSAVSRVKWPRNAPFYRLCCESHLLTSLEEKYCSWLATFGKTTFQIIDPF